MHVQTEFRELDRMASVTAVISKQLDGGAHWVAKVMEAKIRLMVNLITRLRRWPTAAALKWRPAHGRN